jgi:hypothetical protein
MRGHVQAHVITQPWDYNAISADGATRDDCALRGFREDV